MSKARGQSAGRRFRRSIIMSVNDRPNYRASIKQSEKEKKDE